MLEREELRENLRSNAQCPEQFLPGEVMKKIESLLGAEV